MELNTAQGKCSSTRYRKYPSFPFPPPLKVLGRDQLRQETCQLNRLATHALGFGHCETLVGARARLVKSTAALQSRLFTLFVVFAPIDGTAYAAR